ncbi:MAG: LPS export ABC transporter permease LptF [Limimaricola sp.]|nr:LPS export ABC transporter permease LptF [Limimaricola sp.]
MLSQLLMLFGFFALVLVLVYWINQAVRLFDDLIAEGQTAGVFLEFTALSLPGVIRVVLPIAAFAASVYVTNRMTSESELVAAQAAGMPPGRIARPVLVFGVIVGALMLMLTHVLVPAATVSYNDRQAEIARNPSAHLLTEGQFLNPTAGITFYIRAITPAGELLDIFLSDSRNPAQAITYTAAKAYLTRTDAGPQLVMRNGMAQIFDQKDGHLSVTHFADFAYDIGALVPAPGPRGRSSRELSTAELLAATPALQKETGRSAGQLVAEGHDRTDQALLTLVAALLGHATLMVGGFSRFGVWRQILAAIGLVILVKAAETVGGAVAAGDPRLWPVVYLPAVLGGVLVWALLALAARPGLLRRRRTVAGTGVAA